MQEVCGKCRPLFDELQKEILLLRQKDKEQEKRIEELEGKVREKNKPNFIKDPVNHYHQKNTCHPTLKGWVCDRHVFLGCSELKHLLLLPHTKVRKFPFR